MDTNYWNRTMGSQGLNGGLLGSSWFNPQVANAAVMPGAVGGFAMPTGADLNWSGFGAEPMSPFAPAGVDTRYAPGFDGGLPNTGGGGGFGNWIKNGDNLGAVVQGIGALTSAWLGYKNLGVAKDQLRFQKEAFNRNFANQTQNYNTSLEDRIRGRTSDYEGKEADVQAYLAKHRLPTSG